jgi:hypothetical protein
MWWRGRASAVSPNERAAPEAALLAFMRRGGRQAQFQLWIFSYHVFAKSANATLSRLLLARWAWLGPRLRALSLYMIASAIGHPSDKSRRLQSVDRDGTKEFNQKVVPCS